MKLAVAESSLIAQILRKPDESNNAALQRFYDIPGITADMFSDPFLSSCFSFIAEAADQDVAITPEALAAQFDDSELAESIHIKLSKTKVDEVPLYAKIIQKAYFAQSVSKAAQKMMEVAQGDNPEEVYEILAGLTEFDTKEEKRIFSMTEQAMLFVEQFHRFQEEVRQKVPRPIFPLRGLNELVPRIMRDDVVLLSAQSKIGKSSFASQMALHNAFRGMKVLLFHFEDNPEKVGYRRAAQMQMFKYKVKYPHEWDNMGMSYREMFSGSILPAEKMQEVETLTADAIRQCPGLTYVYSAGWSAHKTIATWRQLHKEHDYDLIIIDYLNKISLTQADIKAYGQFNARGEHVELFKQECGRPGANVPLLLVQQENPDGTSRDSKSSYIKAQCHISLQRDQRADKPGTMDLEGRAVVVRANDGGTGAVPATFYPRYMIWY